MRHYSEFYIGGRWIAPAGNRRLELVNPSSEEAYATVAMGDAEDVNRAVAAARGAFPAYAATTPQDRIALLDRIIAAYQARSEALSDLIAREMGCPKSLATQISGPLEHMWLMRELLAAYPFETRIGSAVVRREPIGVCGLISPWNWPLQTPAIKIVYALAAGNTVVLKPSEASPLSALMLAEILDEAGVPPGVFNLVIGAGHDVGEAISRHPDIDMVSFTGSTRAGIRVAEAGAGTVKRISQELGGKSANIFLPDADLESAARWSIRRCFFNAGQSCHAPSRLFVHRSQMDAVTAFLRDEAGQLKVGDPLDPDTDMGPLVNRAQFTRVQGYIRAGQEAGATLVCGGPGRPEPLTRGFFTRPTVFSEVTTDMSIATEEIFGPVMSVLAYEDLDHAVEIANTATPYGLGGYVFSGSEDAGYELATRLRAGRIFFNGADAEPAAPMGGYRQSGNGREMGIFGLEEYLETKSVFGFADRAAALPDHAA